MVKSHSAGSSATPRPPRPDEVSRPKAPRAPSSRPIELPPRDNPPAVEPPTNQKPGRGRKQGAKVRSPYDEEDAPLLRRIWDARRYYGHTDYKTINGFIDARKAAWGRWGRRSLNKDSVWRRIYRRWGRVRPQWEEVFREYDEAWVRCRGSMADCEDWPRLRQKLRQLGAIPDNPGVAASDAPPWEFPPGPAWRADRPGSIGAVVNFGNLGEYPVPWVILDALVASGYLRVEDRSDPEKIKNAIYRLLAVRLNLRQPVTDI